MSQRSCPSGRSHPDPSVLGACLLVLGSLLPSPVQGQIVTLAPPDTVSSNYFGSAVAMDGDTAVIGAPGSDLCGPNSGAAYVYRRGAADAWLLQQQLTPSTCVENHFFGKVVDVSKGLIVVSSYRPFFRQSTSNAVHVFRQGEDGFWNQVQRVQQPDTVNTGLFAADMALDGGRLAVTTSGDTSNAKYNGVVYVFELDAESRFQHVHLLTPETDPDTAVSGIAVALDGNTLALGASTYARNRPGLVTVFDASSEGKWVETSVIRSVDAFFISLDLETDRLVIGENRGGKNRSGRVRVLERTAGDQTTPRSWVVSATILPLNPFPHGSFGTIVRLSGNRLVVVGYDEQLALDVNIDRIAYVFTRENDGTWMQSQVIDVGHTSFAAALDIQGDLVLIGQAGDGRAGQAYMVRIR